MKKIVIFFILFVFLFSLVSIAYGANCPSGQKKIGGKCYKPTNKYHKTSDKKEVLEYKDSSGVYHYYYKKSGNIVSGVVVRGGSKSDDWDYNYISDGNVDLHKTMDWKRRASAGGECGAGTGSSKCWAAHFGEPEPEPGSTPPTPPPSSTTPTNSKTSNDPNRKKADEKPKDEWHANSPEKSIFREKGEPHSNRKKDKTIRCYSDKIGKAHGYKGAVCFKKTGDWEFQQVTVDKKGKVTAGMKEKVVGEANNRQHCTLSPSGVYQSCTTLSCKKPPYKDCNKGKTPTDLTYLNTKDVKSIANGEIEVKTSGEMCAGNTFTCFSSTETCKTGGAHKAGTCWLNNNDYRTKDPTTGFTMNVYGEGTKMDGPTITINGPGGTEIFRGTREPGTNKIKSLQGKDVTCTGDAKKKTGSCSWTENDGHTYTIDNTKKPAEIRDKSDDYDATYTTDGRMKKMNTGGAEFVMATEAGKPCPPASGSDCTMRGKQGNTWLPAENYDCSKVKDPAKCRNGRRVAARGGKYSWLGAINAMGSGIATAGNLCGLAKNSAFCADAGLSVINEFFEGNPIGQFLSGNWEDMICMNWKDMQGGNTGALIDPRMGTVSAWIAGDCYPYTAMNTTTDREEEYLCKFSFEVNPSGICQLPAIPDDPHTPMNQSGTSFDDEFIEFELRIEGPGSTVIDLDKGPGDDYFKIPCNMSTYRLSGASMIVRKYDVMYEHICMQFREVDEQKGGEDPYNLRGVIKGALQGGDMKGDMKLCNGIGMTEFTLTEGQVPGGSGGGEGSHIPDIVN